MTRAKRSSSSSSSSKNKKKSKSHSRNASTASARDPTATPSPGPPNSRLEHSHIVDHDLETGRYRIRFVNSHAEYDVWLLKDKIADALVKKWEDAGERQSRKRVSFCETVLRKRINAAGNAIVGEEKLREPEEPTVASIEVIEGVEVSPPPGKENIKSSKGGSKGKR